MFVRGGPSEGDKAIQDGAGEYLPAADDEPAPVASPCAHRPAGAATIAV